MGPRPPRARLCCPAGEASSAPPATTTASPRCSWAAAPSTGVRLLGTRTVAYMTRNHLPGDVDLEAFGRPLFAETTFDGMGFGLGFSVMQDPVKNKVLSQAGEYAWGGAFSTAFFVDPAEKITALFLTQLLPSRPTRSGRSYGSSCTRPWSTDGARPPARRHGATDRRRGPGSGTGSRRPPSGTRPPVRPATDRPAPSRIRPGAVCTGA